MADILLIDDDEALAEALQMYLQPNNHQLRHGLTPSRAFRMMEEQVPDLVLLDVMMPEQDGFSVCREIRHGRVGTATAASAGASSANASPANSGSTNNGSTNNGSARAGGDPAACADVPIIMLTARGDITDRVVGLEMGADDYLAKPFEPRELLARINSILRRRVVPATSGIPAPDTTAATDGLRIERDKRRAWLDGDLLELSTLEYELLLLLMSEPGKNWSRDEIMSRLKGTDAMLFSRAVDTLVSRLRQRLGDTSRQPRFIKTVWGRGYTFLQ